MNKLFAISNTIVSVSQKIGAYFISKDKVDGKVKISVLPLVLVYMAYSSTVCTFSSVVPVGECIKTQLDVIKEVLDVI